MVDVPAVENTTCFLIFDSFNPQEAILSHQLYYYLSLLENLSLEVQMSEYCPQAYVDKKRKEKDSVLKRIHLTYVSKKVRGKKSN